MKQVMSTWPGIHGPGAIVWPLRSGSSGNCLLIASAGEVILVDAGFGAQRTFRDALLKIGLQPSRVSGILVTHTHFDHLNYHTLRFAEKHAIPLYVHTRNWESAYRLYWKDRLKDNPPWKGERHLFRFGEPFSLASSGFEVEAAQISHDGGACSCFLVTCREAGCIVGVATDLGAWNRKVARFMSRADYLVVEANWDPAMIENSSRDPLDVARVMSDRGHLSNPDAASLIREASLLRGAPPIGVMLAHLSEDHNTMKRALRTVRRILRESGLGRVEVIAAPRGRMGEPVVLSDPDA